MTRNVRTIAKEPETPPFSLSILELCVVAAIYMTWLIVSLIMH
jgi:hypothetical protein